MNNNKALANLVKAARKARQMDDAMAQNGYSSYPYREIYGLIADAVYSFIGEDTDRYEDSVTHHALNSYILTEKQAAQILAGEYNNHQEETSFHIPDNAFRIISDAAREKQISISLLVDLIMNQWALQHQYAKSFAI